MASKVKQADRMKRIHLSGIRKVFEKVAELERKGAAAALTGPQDCVNKIVREFDRRRKLVMDRLSEIEGMQVIRPQGAFYTFPSIKETGRSSQEIADYLLEEAGVTVVPGSAFGSLGEGYIRIAYSTSYDDLEEGLSRMKAALAKLRSQ